MDQLLPGYEPTPSELVERMTMQERIDRAIALLKANEPEDGYFVADSGGKDSCVIVELCRMAGVKHECFYKSTTIDPPELIRFLKKYHPNTKWILPEYGNMMHRVATKCAAPPTRMVRWCCDEYKEGGETGRVKVLGVRAAESHARKKWSEIAKEKGGNKVVCPIVYWVAENVWEFIEHFKVPYCELYDEPGIDRIGCVGCPLNDQSRLREFKRWPAFERNWKRAIIANWQNFKDVPREDGKPRFQARFKTGEDFWKWWMKEQTADPLREDCQTMQLWTNQEEQ